MVRTLSPGRSGPRLIAGAVLLLTLASPARALGAEAPKPPLTPQQQAKLKERDGYLAKARELFRSDGAIRTTGPSPPGGSTRSPGGSHISGPTTRSHDGHARGYSSAGSVATSVKPRESPVWT